MRGAKGACNLSVIPSSPLCTYFKEGGFVGIKILYYYTRRRAANSLTT
jgi:hypothetical protein